jgi:hypothetical protein
MLPFLCRYAKVLADSEAELYDRYIDLHSSYTLGWSWNWN